MSPPGLTATTERPGVHITGDKVTDLSTKSGQERYLVNELGVTYPQAKALLRAYELDQRDADARDLVREEFGGWLKSNYWQAVGRRSAPKVSTGDWRVRS